MNLTILEPRLENWAAAQRGPGAVPTCTSSAEGRYRAGFRESCEGALLIDTLDAARVNAACRALMPLDREVLQLYYVWRAHSSFICRRLKLKQGRGHAHVWDFALLHAQRAVWARLYEKDVVSPKTSGYTPARLLIPA